MTTWIALLRGINVGGRNILPMKELTRELEKIGCSNVQTYIQSGNVVFQSSVTRADSLAKRISQAILKSHGFRPGVMVLSAKEVEDAASSNPFPNAEVDPKSLHLFFLARAHSTIVPGGIIDGTEAHFNIGLKEINVTEFVRARAENATSAASILTQLAEYPC